MAANNVPFTECTGSFLHWNLPYEALVAVHPIFQDHPSPFGSSPATPANLIVNSPGALGSPSTHQQAPSPTTQLIQRKVLLERSNLFLAGRGEELLGKVPDEDR